MKNITVILPVHKLDESYKQMLSNSVASVENFYNDVNLMIVGPSNLKDEVIKNINTEKLSIEYITNTGNTNFTSQINLGITNCKTEWFSILEIDDEYRENWLSRMNEHIQNKETDVVLSVIKEINNEGKFMGYMNESVWAYGFTDEIGYLDNETLIDYQNFQISGGLYKTETILSKGLFKDNIELTFGYEFLLRLSYAGAKISVLPYVTYTHVNFREDSLFWLYKNDESLMLSKEMVDFWFEVAKKEFFYKNKRDIIMKTS